jgi:hypothetical protein
MPRKKKSCEIGDVVRIVFDDHGEGSDIFVFEVYGRVIKKSRRDIVVASWTYADVNEPVDHNCHTFIIIRSAIKEIEIYKSLTKTADPVDHSLPAV